ncbi:MAG: hypothetical protein WDW38_007575 [Sanguina aurantia]
MTFAPPLGLRTACVPPANTSLTGVEGAVLLELLHACVQQDEGVTQQLLWTATPGRSYPIPHPSKQGLVLSLGAGSALGNDITAVAAAFAAEAGFALDARAFPAVVAGSSLQAQPPLPLSTPGALNNTPDSRWPDGWVSGFGLVGAAARAGAMLNLAPLAQIPASLDYWATLPASFGRGLAQYNGSLAAMPFQAEAMVLAYRSDLLLALGLPPPETWEQLVSAAQAMAASAPAAHSSGSPMYGFCGPVEAGTLNRDGDAMLQRGPCTVVCATRGWECAWSCGKRCSPRAQTESPVRIAWPPVVGAWATMLCTPHSVTAASPGAAGCDSAGRLLLSIWASRVQSGGPSSGMFFQPATLQPLLDNAAMAGALDVLSRLWSMGPPAADPAGQTCSAAHAAAITAGRCGFALVNTAQFKGCSLDASCPAHGKLGFVLVPGSAQVLDRASAALRLVQCTSTACPYATPGANLPCNTQDLLAHTHSLRGWLPQAAGSHLIRTPCARPGHHPAAMAGSTLRPPTLRVARSIGAFQRPSSHLGPDTPEAMRTHVHETMLTHLPIRTPPGLSAEPSSTPHDGTPQLVNRALVYSDAQVMFVNSQSDPLTQLSMHATMGWMTRLEASLAYTLDPALAGIVGLLFVVDGSRASDEVRNSKTAAPSPGPGLAGARGGPPREARTSWEQGCTPRRVWLWEPASLQSTSAHARTLRARDRCGDAGQGTEPRALCCA